VQELSFFRFFNLAVDIWYVDERSTRRSASNCNRHKVKYIQPSGVLTHDEGTGTVEGITCFRPLGHCDKR
jgi:hypothetical protein